MLTGAPVPYAMARDGLFPRSLSHVSPRTHVPTGALIVQAVWACILVIVFSSSFDTLTDYAIFGLMIFYVLCTAGVFVLRRKMPDAERPYRVLGYPVVPILFILSAPLSLASTLVGARGEGVLVGDQEVTVVLVLEGQSVLDAPDVVAEVQLTRGRVAGEDAGLGGRHTGEVIGGE
jgi:amino acid transporter